MLDRNSEELIQSFNLIAPLIEVSKVNWPATFDRGNTLAGILHHFALDWLSRFGALPGGAFDIMDQVIVFGRYRGQKIKENNQKSRTQ